MNVVANFWSELLEEEILAELKRIRGLLEPKPPPSTQTPKGLWSEFKDFISKYKVMGIAVGFIIGIYLGALVQSLVNNLIMPIVQLAIPETTSWQAISVGPFQVGAFAGALMTFLIVSFVIFLLVKITKRWGIE
jgi:large conductance mechanosensitive channel